MCGSALIAEHMKCFEGCELPPGFPSDPARLTRKQMVDWIAEDSVRIPVNVISHSG